MREWMSEPDDERPIIGHCAECGEEIHDETDGYYADRYYDFSWLGNLVCENCLKTYCDKNFGKGG